MLKPIILAGGTGTRLWPLSRQSYPKQFLRLINNQYTLLQQTALRAKFLNQSINPLVICNQEHYFTCKEQLSTLDITADYILEPIGRNTAPAVAIASFAEMERQRDSLLLVIPSDHLIKDIDAFTQAITLGIQAAKKDLLITFAIAPNQPETGYGYIERGKSLDIEGAYSIATFVEKPTLSHAEQLVANGNYFWNSGIFLFKASVYLDELKHYACDIYDTSKQAFEQANHQEHILRLNEKSFGQCRNESIDYAVLEKTSRSATIPLDAGWSDLGCWNAIAEANNRDANNNLIQGDVLAYETKNCLINAEDKLIATAGLKDHIVVSTKDSVLVAHKDYAQSVKNVVQELQKLKHQTTNTHTKVYRPWGYYENLLLTPIFNVKQIVVNPGGKLSLQLHHHRSEHWVVVDGIAEVICGEECIQLKQNEHVYIPKQIKHRLSNISNITLVVIETQIGDYLGEDDIIRFDDIYNRVMKKSS